MRYINLHLTYLLIYLLICLIILPVMHRLLGVAGFICAKFVNSPRCDSKNNRNP